MNGELPLRIVAQPGGAVIRCLCGAEVATVRRGLARGHRMAVSQPGLSPDVTPAGLLMMIAHAGRCQRGQQIQANLQTPVANVSETR